MFSVSLKYFINLINYMLLDAKCKQIIYNLINIKYIH